MRNLKRLLMALLVMVFMLSSVGTAAAAPSQQNCRAYHTVRYGETLSSIAYWYGVYWPYLAQVNNILPPRYTVYTGLSLCIPAGSGYYGTGGPYGPGWPYGTGGPYNSGGRRTWSFAVTSVTPNATVTIQTSNLPDWVTFNVKIGRYTNGAYTWVNLPDLATQAGGARTINFTIPAQFNGATQLVLRLIQAKKNGRVFSMDQTFYNNNYGTGGPYPNPYPPYGYYGVPTIWITGVQANTQVSIETRNFPPGITFDVLMGPIGWQGVGGYQVGTLYSGSGGSVSAAFNIPSQLAGHRQIAIRLQNWATGYYSYNWFYNSNY